MKRVIYLITFIFLFSSFCFAKTPNQNTKDYLNLPFWEKFNDEILINNILKAYENNIDLKITSLKVKESEKIVKSSLAQELPLINFEGLLGRTFSSSDLYRGSNNFMINSYHQTRFLLPLNFSYEVDLWGKKRLKTKTETEQLKMFKENERTAYILLTSAVAADYYNLIKVDKLLELNKNLYILTYELRKLTKNKETAGLASTVDVLEVEENLIKIKASINSLEDRKEVLKNQLSYLLGDKLFLEIERNSFESINLIDNFPSELDSNVILNRPDVKSAQNNILKNDYEARIAKKDILPSFAIAGSLGYNGYGNLSNLIKPGTGLFEAWIVPNLDIFDGGKKYNLLKLRKLKLDEAKKQYEKTVLISIKEVNDALALLKKEDKNYKLAKNVLDIQSKKLKLKENNKIYGLASEVDCILYKQAEILAEEKYVEDKINQIIASINLYKATGGADFTLFATLNQVKL